MMCEHHHKLGTFYRNPVSNNRINRVNFFLQPTNLALLAIAVVSGLLLLQPLLFKSNAKHVNTSEATQLINKKAQIIDVRTSEEFARGHIRQSKLSPLSNLNEQLPLAKLKQDKPVLIVCESGMRARRAASLLAKQGYTDVAVLDGGIRSWQEAQLPIAKG